MARAANDLGDALDYLERGKIKAREIGHCAKKLLEFLAGEGIDSGEKLALKIVEGKKRFQIEDKAQVEIDTQLSGRNTYADTISYIVENRGILIEVRVNNQLNYRMVTVKSCDVFPNYTLYASDMFGNAAQEKHQKGSNFQWVLNELEQLKKNS